MGFYLIWIRKFNLPTLPALLFSFNQKPQKKIFPRSSHKSL